MIISIKNNIVALNRRRRAYKTKECVKTVFSLARNTHKGTILIITCIVALQQIASLSLRRFCFSPCLPACSSCRPKPYCSCFPRFPFSRLLAYHASLQIAPHLAPLHIHARHYRKCLSSAKHNVPDRLCATPPRPAWQ